MITVASYNIRKAIGTDRRRRPDRILSVIDEIGADVVALQECDRRFGPRQAVLPRHMLEEHGWRAAPVAMRAVSLGWHGNGLLVGPDVVLLDCEPIHLPAFEPRGAVMADLRVRGTPIRVVGMHLDLSGLWRRRQAHAILTHLAACRVQMPTVLMGDLNEWRRKGGCLTDFGRDHVIASTGPSFHARRPVGRLDRIMVSRSLKIIDCGVQDSAAARGASDHLPIWARLAQG